MVKIWLIKKDDMELAQLFFITLSILVLIIIAVVFIKNPKIRKEIDSITGLGFGLILIGMFFNGDDRFIGYGLMAAGVIFIVVDTIWKVKKAKQL